jgi:hypothetical protein
MLKASLRFKTVAASMGAALAMMASNNAHAVFATEATQVANNVQLTLLNTNVGATNSLLGNIYATLGFIPGTTVVGELADILGQLKGNAQLDSNNVAEQDRRARLKDAEQRYYKAEMQAMPTVKQCQDLTQASSRGGAGASGMQASRSAASQSVNTALTTKSDAGSAGRIVSNRQSNGTCSADDAQHGRTGCSGAGQMPSADAAANSFFQTMTSDGGVTNSNLSFTTQQVALIKGTNGDTLANHIAMPFPPPTLPDSVEKTPQGLAYLALKLSAVLRASTASYALSQISGLRTPDSSGQFSGTRTLSGGTNAVAWGSVQPIYKRMFPQDQFPQNPSQAEILRYEVASRYVDAGSNSWMSQIATMDPDDMQREQLKLQALQAYMQWLEYQRLEEGNAMLASLVGQSEYPITNETLQAASQRAMQNQH